MTQRSRTFDDAVAVRASVPLLVGLFGPSGSGKTYSALRLAAGMQHVTGGDIFVVDTEARRALHYADRFKFRHVPFNAPFSPMDYLAAIEHCVNRGAKVIVIDSMSHEHEGPGGVLEMHAQGVERMAKGDPKKAAAVSMLAWSEPKQQRRRLINSIVQTGANMVFCFRAKEKLEIRKGKEPAPLGWMPIAGEEFVYEMTLAALLPAGARGLPEWNPEWPGERAMTKLPAQFEWMRGRKELDEDAGERMATWARGGESTAFVPETIADADAALLGQISSAKTQGELEALVPRLREAGAKATLRGAYKRRMDELAATSREPGYDDEPPADWQGEVRD